MIFGHFLNWDEDKRALSPVLVEALEIIRSKFYESIDDGVYPISEDGTRLIVKEVTTTPFEELPPEKHELFIEFTTSLRVQKSMDSPGQILRISP